MIAVPFRWKNRSTRSRSTHGILRSHRNKDCRRCLFTAPTPERNRNSCINAPSFSCAAGSVAARHPGRARHSHRHVARLRRMGARRTGSAPGRAAAQCGGAVGQRAGSRAGGRPGRRGSPGEHDGRRSGADAGSHPVTPSRLQGREQCRERHGAVAGHPRRPSLPPARRTTTSAADSFMNLGWGPPGRNAMRILMQFDMGPLPANAHITSARVLRQPVCITPANDSTVHVVPRPTHAAVLERRHCHLEQRQLPGRRWRFRWATCRQPSAGSPATPRAWSGRGTAASPTTA